MKPLVDLGDGPSRRRRGLRQHHKLFDAPGATSRSAALWPCQRSDTGTGYVKRQRLTTPMRMRLSGD